MQRIADDFTSIRQEMERIEAERRGAKPETIEVKVVGGGSVYFTGLASGQPIPSWAIGTVKLQNGQIVTYTDWTDYIVHAGVPIVEVAAEDGS